MNPKSKTTEPEPVAVAASASVLAAVFGNYDILREILLRLGFPTCLVRAAAVCKDWLKIASDPDFLRRFRDLHPPRLLGFYVSPQLRFVPLPQPPELASVVRLCSRFPMSAGVSSVLDCRNGRVLTHPGALYAICLPLRPDLVLPTFPPSPSPITQEGSQDLGILYYSYVWAMVGQAMLLPEDGGDGLSITVVSLMLLDDRFWVHVCESQAGAWVGEGRKSNTIDALPEEECEPCSNFALLSCGKVYMIGRSKHILELDLASTSLVSIELPEGVEYDADEVNLRLSRAEGVGFYLVHVTKGFKLCVWQYSMDHSGAADWKLVDTICLHEVLAQLGDPAWLSEGAVCNVAAVGDNAEFVFFKVERKLFYLHVSSRAVEKVIGLTLNNSYLLAVNPLMMPWPPTFPVIKNTPISDQIE